MKQPIQNLTITDVIVFAVILAAGLAFIWFYEKPKEKKGLKAVKPRRDEITRADILDAKLSSNHEQYVAMSKVLDEHEVAITR